MWYDLRPISIEHTHTHISNELIYKLYGKQFVCWTFWIAWFVHSFTSLTLSLSFPFNFHIQKHITTQSKLNFQQSQPWILRLCDVCVRSLLLLFRMIKQASHENVYVNIHIHTHRHTKRVSDWMLSFDQFNNYSMQIQHSTEILIMLNEWMESKE